MGGLPDFGRRLALGARKGSDTAFVVATVLNDGRTSDVALRATSTIYGRLEPTPLTLGWPGDPHYTYVYQSGYSEGNDGTITIGCGRYERALREVRAGQQVLARVGITRAGAQVVVRWWTLDEVRSDPRIAAWRDARNGAERRRRAAAMRPYFWSGDSIFVTQVRR
jgi:hypothetical protein